MIITTREKANNIINSNSVIKPIEFERQKLLDQLYDKLQNEIGCTYMFYIYEDLVNDSKIIYTSNWAWQNKLIGEKIINKCPIFQAGSKALSAGRRSIILPWNYIHCNTPLEKDITLFRSEFNIANGIGVSHKNGRIREGIGLGADIKDFSFSHRLLEGSLIYKILINTRMIALNNINHHLFH